MPLEPKQEPPYYEITDGPNPQGTKYYIALLTQSGTDAPTAVIIRNTLSGTPTLARTNTGAYTITLTGEFLEEKTISWIGTGNLGVTEDNPVISTINRISNNALEINTSDQAFLGADGNLVSTPVTITVYP